MKTLNFLGGTFLGAALLTANAQAVPADDAATAFESTGSGARDAKVSFNCSITAATGEMTCNHEQIAHRVSDPANFSQELMDYIKDLEIKDPLFYDAFTEDEVYQLFKRSDADNGGRVPFYIWDGHPGFTQFYTKCSADQEIYAFLLSDRQIDTVIFIVTLFRI